MSLSALSQAVVSSFEADEASAAQWEGRSLMLGNVRCRYPEAGPFMIPPKNLLLPNLPELAEYKA